MTIEVAMKVDTPKIALIHLHDEAKKEDQEMATVIYVLKINNDYKKNYSSLHKFSRELLAKTYAWLMKVGVDNEEIAQMNKEGLKKMMVWRISQITAEQCRSCHKVVHLQRKEEYLVTCWECGKGACKDCYPADLSGGKNWRYLCSCCLDTTENLRGFQALKPDADLYKVKPKKKPKQTDANNVEVEDDSPNDKEEDNPANNDDSCVFTEGVEKPNEQPVVEVDVDDPRTAFVEPVDRRGFLGKKSKDTGEKDNRKTKTCSHFLRGRCKFGMSGRRPRKEVEKEPGVNDECPYEHPRVCSKLLNHGDSNHSKFGCNGSSCKKAHPTMCTTSMHSRQCWKLCDKGWHVKGTKFEDGKVPLQHVQKQFQKKTNNASPHDFPPLVAVRPSWNGNHSQQQPENTRRIPTQPDLSFPPPTLKGDQSFKCPECNENFKYKTEFRNHFKTEHSQAEDEREASFLVAVQKTLLKMLPNALETCLQGLVADQDPAPNQSQSRNQHHNGNNGLKWRLVPVNLQ